MTLIQEETPATIVVVVLQATSSLGLRCGITMDRFCEGAPTDFSVAFVMLAVTIFLVAKCGKKEPWVLLCMNHCETFIEINIKMKLSICAR